MEGAAGVPLPETGDEQARRRAGMGVGKPDLLADVEEAKALLATATRQAVQDALRAVVRTQEAQLRVMEEEEARKAADEEKAQAWLAEAAAQLEGLEAQKAKAAADEDYEACARLRDEIAALKEQMEKPAEAAAAAPAPPVAAPARPKVEGVEWRSLDKFAWDQGEYNTPWVSVYVTLPGVGAVKDSVSCDFTAEGFDLKVMGLEGVNYRLLKDPLEKEVEVGKCKFIVKKDRVTIKLRKIKGEYSYDNWTDLVPKRVKSADEKAADKDNPSSGIMDMMKDMVRERD